MLKVADRTTPAAKPKLQAEVIAVTPDMASQWLEQNKHNRRMSIRTVRRYAHDMLNKQWQITGDAIRFDEDRNLIDGQHRLKACVQANVPFETVVIYSLPSSVQNVLDSGKSRSASDVLQLNGVANSVSAAATARILLNERDGDSGNISGYGAFTNADVLAMLKKHCRLPLYVLNGGSMPRGITYSHPSALNYIGCVLLKETDCTQAMINVLKTGVPDFDGDPIHMYRERILRMRNEDLKISGRAQWWTLKHCFNLFRKRQPVQQLKFAKRPTVIDGLDVSQL